MADQSPKSKVWLTLRGREGNIHEQFNSSASTCDAAIEQISKLLARHPESNDLVVVSFTWRLSGGSPNDESDLSGGVS